MAGNSVFSGLYDNTPSIDGKGDEGHSFAHANRLNRSALGRRLNRVFRGGIAGKRFAAIITALTGAAVGGTATASNSQRTHPTTPTSVGAMGGSATITSVSLINTATVSADETGIEEAIARDAQPASYPVDASGNGGGGRLTAKYKTVGTAT